MEMRINLDQIFGSSPKPDDNPNDISISSYHPSQADSQLTY